MYFIFFSIEEHNVASQHLVKKKKAPTLVTKYQSGGYLLFVGIMKLCSLWNHVHYGYGH